MSIRVIYLKFVILQIFYLLIVNSAVNQANYSAPSGRYFLPWQQAYRSVWQDKAPSKLPPAGGSDFYSIANSLREQARRGRQCFGPANVIYARCVASQKGLEQGAKRRRGKPRQGFAKPRRAFLIATRREWGENSATPRCAPSPEKSQGVVARLDWRCFHPASAHSDGKALALAVQPLDAWRELWVFRKSAGQWTIEVLPPASNGPELGYVEFAGWVRGAPQL